MAHLDTESGLMVDDDEGTAGDNGGSVGEQDGAPSFAPPPPIPASNPLAQPMPAAPDPASFVPQATGAGVVTRRPVLSPADTANLGAIADNNAALDATATGERDTAEQAGNAKVDRAVEAAANAQAEADLKDQQAQAAEATRQQHEARVHELQQKHEQAYEKYKAMGLKDPDAESSFGHKLAAALAIGLGQYSAAINHTSNAAAKLFEDARQENYMRQRSAIEKAKDEAIAAGTDVREAMADAAASQAILHTKQIAQIDAFRSKFAADSARLGIPEARIAASQTMQALDKAALNEREKHLDAFQRHLDATRIYERGLTPKEKGGGKGGGGGGGGTSSAAEQLAIAIKEGVTSDSGVRRPLTQDEKIHKANELKIPLEGKAGQITLKTITAESTFETEQARKAAKSGTGSGTLARDEAGKPIGYLPTPRQLAAFTTRDADYARAEEAMRKYADDIRKNGERVIGLDAQKRRNALYANAVGAVAGTSPLGKTIEAQHLEEKSLGSPGTGFGGILMGASLDNAEAKMQDIRAHRARYRAETLTPLSEDDVAAAAAAPAAKSPAKDRRALAQEAIDDPDAPPAVKARAHLILRGK